MKSLFHKVFAWVFLVALLLPAAAMAAECPGGKGKVDNFVIFLDYSGSMSMTHQKTGKLKMSMAKDIMTSMVDRVPDYSYNAGFVTFAPYGVVVPPKRFDRAALKSAIASIKSDYEIFDRQTTMGSGILALDKVLEGMNGSTAVIMLTDGAYNLGPDPVQATRDLYRKHGDRLCIHIIDMGSPDMKEGGEIIKQLASLNSCTMVVDATKFGDKEVAEFTSKIFAAQLNPPKAVIDGPSTVNRGQSVTFSGEKSSDPDKERLSYSWKTCEGRTGTGPTFTTTIGQANCEVALTVTDPAGCTDTARKVVTLAGEERIVLRGINFDFDRSNIKPEFVPVLEQAVSILKANPSMMITVEGHTDSVGTVEYNQGLSERRAASVRDFLVKNGVSAGRISTVGYSELKPKYDNNTAEGRYLNRRVEFQVNR